MLIYLLTNEEKKISVETYLNSAQYKEGKILNAMHRKHNMNFTEMYSKQEILSLEIQDKSGKTKYKA